MSNKKSVSVKTVSILLVLVLLLGLAVGGTVAWLATESAPVVNTFTFGDINIKLEESDIDGDNDKLANTYKLIPGQTIDNKDPKFTVIGGSEACWVFVKLEESGAGTVTNSVTGADDSTSFGDFLEYNVDHTFWKELPSADGVYYGIVPMSDTDTELYVLDGNRVTVKDTVTKEMVNKLTEYPKLTITGYAVQYTAADDSSKTEIENAEAAWVLAGTKGVPPQNPPVTP